jgi:RNA polymerase sigma-70 factor (ECF subfamily)
MDFQSTLWTVIRSARQGDEGALRQFVLSYRGPVVAYAARRGLGADAEDIAQEVFLRLVQDRLLDRADPSRGRFRSLLLAVTRHVIGHHRDKEHAAKRGGGKTLALPDLQIAAADPDFDREWISHLTRIGLARLARDHPVYHEALRRFVLEEHSYAQIGAALGCTETDVKNRVFRGKKKLADYIRDEIRDYSASPEEFQEELAHLSRFLPSE